MSSKLSKQLAILKSNSWLNTTQIQTIAECGFAKAVRIRQACNEELNKRGYRSFHETKVPTDILIDVLGINIEFMEKQEKSPSAN